jgi:hypothetical protein
VTDIKAVWKQTPPEERIMMNLNNVEQRARRLQMKLRRRNLWLYAYSATNVIISLWLIATGQAPRFLAPMLLMIAAHLFVVWEVWLRFGSRPMSPQASAQSALDFQRQELERQHRAVANAGLWYIAPFMPAFIWELAIWLHGIDLSTPTGAAAMRSFVMVIFSAVLFWSCVGSCSPAIRRDLSSNWSD